MDDAYFEQRQIPKIDTETLRKLTVLKPWRSLIAIFMDWTIIALCVVLCVSVSYWFYPLAFIIIGSRFHALEGMMHEATHYRLHPNKRFNDIVGELSVWPMGLSLYLYRKVRHFSHHKYVGTPGDSHITQSYKRYADRFDIPKPMPGLLRSCVEAAMKFPDELWLGQLYGTARLLPRFSKLLGRLWIGFQLLILAGLIWGSIAIGPKVFVLYFLFLVLPLMWVAVFSRYLRLLAEHFGIPPKTPNPTPGGETRTVLVSWPVRVFFWPHNLNYHLEHHWYPSVPYYNLPALHKLLCASPQVRQNMHITRGVRCLFTELTSSKFRTRP